MHIEPARVPGGDGGAELRQPSGQAEGILVVHRILRRLEERRHHLGRGRGVGIPLPHVYHVPPGAAGLRHTAVYLDVDIRR